MRNIVARPPKSGAQATTSTKSDEAVFYESSADGVPRRIKKAETGTMRTPFRSTILYSDRIIFWHDAVLSRRTAQIVLVLESSCDMFNQQAVLRTGALAFVTNCAVILLPFGWDSH